MTRLAQRVFLVPLAANNSSQLLTFDVYCYNFFFFFVHIWIKYFIVFTPVRFYWRAIRGPRTHACTRHNRLCAARSGLLPQNSYLMALTITTLGFNTPNRRNSITGTLGSQNLIRNVFRRFKEGIILEYEHLHFFKSRFRHENVNDFVIINVNRPPARHNGLLLFFFRRVSINTKSVWRDSTCTRVYNDRIITEIFTIICICSKIDISNRGYEKMWHGDLASGRPHGFGSCTCHTSGFREVIGRGKPNVSTAGFAAGKPTSRERGEETSTDRFHRYYRY